MSSSPQTTNTDPSPTTRKASRPNITMNDADEGGEPSGTMPKKPSRTVKSAMQTATQHSTTASPAPHINSRTATRKASRRDLIMGNADNVEKANPQQQQQIQQLRQRRSGNLMVAPTEQQGRSMPANPTVAAGQGDAQGRRRGPIDPAMALAQQQQQQRSMPTTPTTSQRHQEPLRRSMLTTSNPAQLQQRTTSINPTTAGQGVQHLQRLNATNLAALRHRQMQAAQQQQRNAINPGSNPNPNLTPSLNPPTTQPQQPKFQDVVKAQTISGLQRRRAAAGEAPMTDAHIAGISKMIEGFHMVTEHVIKSRGMSRGEALWAWEKLAERTRERTARGLSPFPGVGEDGERRPLYTEEELWGLIRGAGSGGAGNGGGAAGQRGGRQAQRKEGS